MRLSWSLTLPLVGLLNPDTMLSRVDLPQPECPMTQVNSPSATVRSMLSRTVAGPSAVGYILVTRSNVRNGVGMGEVGRGGRGDGGTGRRGDGGMGEGSGVCRGGFMNLMTLLQEIRSNKALLTRDVGRVNFNPKSKTCTVGEASAKADAVRTPLAIVSKIPKC